MVVASGYSRHEYYDTVRTSGVCLQSPSGKKQSTPAKREFPGDVGDRVLGGRCIAEVSKVVGETDMALAELTNIHYSQETFSASGAPVNPFKSPLDISQLQIGSFIHIDTPFNGRCEGILIKVEVRRIPTDEPADNMDYVVGAYGYFGNGADILVDGCGGGRGLGFRL